MARKRNGTIYSLRNPYWGISMVEFAYKSQYTLRFDFSVMYELYNKITINLVATLGQAYLCFNSEACKQKSPVT